MSKHIVIVGGGYTGVLTAKKLEKKLRRQDVRITLVDKNSYHTMLTELHEAAAGRVEPTDVIIPFDKIFRGRRVEVITDTVLSVDTSANMVVCLTKKLRYDYLVFCVGSKPFYFGVDGAHENCFPLWSYDDAVNLKHRIENCFNEAAKLGGCDKRRSLLSFTVVGASATGVETAGELAEYVPELCKGYGIDRSEVSLYIIDAADRAVPSMPEKCAVRLSKRLKKLGVMQLYNRKVTHVSPDGIDYSESGGVRHIGCKTVIWAAGISCPQLTSDISATDKAGRLATDEYLRSKKAQNVYIGGDCLDYTADGEKVPRMVENAEHSADTISENISLEIKGFPDKIPYEPVFHGSMVSCGGRYGTAHVGGKRHKYILPSFLAMLVKHLINVVYFIQVAGWNKVVSYSRHEFFGVHNRRSFVGGQFSRHTVTFLLVPLRVFTGIYWIIEAAEKVASGWFSTPQLSTFFKGAYDFFNSAAGSVPDSTVTSATSATASAELLFRARFLGLFDFAYVKTEGDYALRTGFRLTDWFIDKVVTANGTTELIFQYFILISEFAIGICIALGLFSFISNDYALILQALFLMTTGLYLSTWWLVFASIALLFGSGMSFGIDSIIAPRLKNRLRHNSFFGKWYLYND